MKRPVTAVDLDGTLAASVSHIKPYSPTRIGKPIPEMVERVKTWLSEGKDVEIFTARGKESYDAIRDWCKTHIGKVLPISNIKKPQYAAYYDDRAHRVERNTGRILSSRTKARRLAVS